MNAKLHHNNKPKYICKADREKIALAEQENVQEGASPQALTSVSQ